MRVYWVGISNNTRMQTLQTRFIEKKTEVSEEKYFEMLGVVPPERMAYGGFLVGEAWDHNNKGEPRYQLFIEEGGKFYDCGLATTGEFDLFTVPVTAVNV